MKDVYVLVEDLETTSRKVLEECKCKKDIISIDLLIYYLEQKIDELQDQLEEHYPDPYDEWHDSRL